MSVTIGKLWQRDVYGDPGLRVIQLRPAVELPPPRRAEWPAWLSRLLLWGVLLALAAFALAGCEPLSMPTIGETCRDACKPFPVRSTGYIARGGPTCECETVACSVDRLVVVPTPPGADGKLRRAPEVRP